MHDIIILLPTIGDIKSFISLFLNLKNENLTSALKVLNDKIVRREVLLINWDFNSTSYNIFKWQLASSKANLESFA